MAAMFDFQLPLAYYGVSIGFSAVNFPFVAVYKLSSYNTWHIIRIGAKYFF